MGKKGIHRGLLRALVACAASNAAASDEVSSLASELAAAKAELARFRAAHAASLEPGGVLASNLHVSDDATPQESLDVQAFVDATDDANMSEVEAVATFLAGRSNTELMHAAKAATTLHAPRALRIAAKANGACASASDSEVQALVQEHYDTCAYARPLFYTAVHEAVLGGPFHVANDSDYGASFYASKASTATAQLKAGSTTELQAKCGTRCAQRFRALVSPLADAFHGIPGNASNEDSRSSSDSSSTSSGVSKGVLPVAALNRLHKKFCAPMLVAILDSCGDRTNTPSSSSSLKDKGGQAAPGAEGQPAGSGTSNQVLDATPLAHMYAHTGQVRLLLKLARKGYAVEGQVPPPASEAAQQQPWPPLPSVLIKQGFVEQAWQVIHDDPDRGLEPDAFGVTPLDLLEAHAGKLTNLPYTFVKDGKPKPKQASYPAAKDWVTSGPYGDGGWPTSATVAEEGEKREKELLFPGGSMDTCDFAEVDGEYVAAHPERFITEFVLKLRPVIVRDYVRHDVNLRPLIEHMALEPLILENGNTTWEASEVALPHFFQPNKAKPAALRLDDYLQSITSDVVASKEDGDSDGTKRAPAYIFSTHHSGFQSNTPAREDKGDNEVSASDGTSTTSGTDNLADYADTNKTDSSSVLEMWPQVPSFMQDGIPGLAAFSVNNGQFYVGPPGSGAQLHYHGAAANVLVYGLKGWVIMPPNQAAFSTVTAAQMVQDLADQDAAAQARDEREDNPKNLRCVQRAGDMVIIPEDWGHLTFNLATSVGLAKEFTAHAVTKSSKKKSRKKDETSTPSSSPSGTRSKGSSSSSSSSKDSKKIKRKEPIDIKQKSKKGAPMPPLPISPEEEMQQRVEAAAREWADNRHKSQPPSRRDNEL